MQGDEGENIGEGLLAGTKKYWYRVSKATADNIKLCKILFGALANDVARKYSHPSIIIHPSARRKNAGGEKTD